ncbi:RNA-dependent RNA polymerase 1-like [Oopsacas minuta]|uniref:RNA-directed RNA polymerase n=1 Tax=Oopsacas minuta TaxID=111878 RepID=A0AAV7JDA7_9METZ|nr:RNA-dependent RNA polymerase 1-like [Oopsacas minuta]
MNCIVCKENEFPLENLCFYRKEDNSVHLMVRYESATFLEERFTIDQQKQNKIIIKCLKCDAYLGKKLGIGPNREEIMLFGADKVTINGESLDKKTRWGLVYQNAPFSQIVLRDDDSFLGHTRTPNVTSDSKRIKLSTENTNGEIILPQIEDESHFQYNDILKSDLIPKDYQTIAYIEALQRDFILVLPTGYGKTLVASMAAARMKQLNPNHMVLFIVERVPLVFQQGEAISIDTHLNVCTLTSETNTRLKHVRLNQGYYDVLVSTAGAYIAIQNKVGLHNFCYVVFDECHHAVKSHNYVTILNKIRECEPSRPRVLGLTASPPSSQKKTQITIELLKQFKQNFFNAPICHTLSIKKYQRDDASIQKNIITEPVNNMITQYSETLERGLYQLASCINNCSQEKLINKTDWKDAKYRSQLITMLYELKLHHNDIDKYVTSMKRICKMLDLTEMLGVTYAHQKLRDMDIFEGLDHQPSFSPRLQELFNILNEISDNSKIIIFVETRRMASILATVLKEDQKVNQKFSPLKIVGQSGPFGMNWVNDQEEIIENFRNGKCNLLVSTSVLEEGLDIPVCDVVIRFNGLKSLTSYKQSKGRARKWDNSRFILILSEDENRTFEEIQAQEYTVKSVLKEHHSETKFPSPFTENIIENIQKDIENTVSCSDHSQKCNILSSTECAVEFYLTGTHELFDIQDNIAKILFEKYFLKVKRIEQAACNSRWKSNGIFPFEDSLLNLGLQTQKPNIYERYKLLTVQWSFSIGNGGPEVWTRVRVPLDKEMKYQTKWTVNKISWGKFNDKHTFQVTEQLEANTFGEKGIFELSSDRTIHITIRNQADSRLTIEIPFASIFLFMLADWRENDVMLYLPLSFCPKVLSQSGEMLSCDNCSFLRFFGESPVFGISLAYKTSNWSKLWIFLHSPNTLSVPVYDSRIIECTSMETEAIILSDNSLYWDKEMQDCLWEFYVLKSIRNICLPEETIRKFTKEIYVADLSLIRALSKTFSYLLSLRCKDTTYYFFDLQSSFDKYLDTLKDYPLSSPASSHDNYCYIECAMVTPSTVIPLQSVFTQRNRLYRKFPKERFLNLAFREEHGEALKSSDVIDRVKNIIINGVTINGLNFYFLVCSGSQLRSKRAIFIHIRDGCVSETLRNMRHELMGDSIVANETKYLSRLGLFCTSDHPICDIPEANTHCLSDLFADNGLNLTDGNGKIRRSVAEKIFDNSEIVGNASLQNISAIQVRLAGLKGVFTIVDADTDTDFNSGLLHCDILYRKSMKKIEWTQSTLCLVKLGKYNDLHLNTQMMTLLTSLEDCSEQNWDPKPRLRAIYKEVLERNVRIFTDITIASTELTSHLPHNSNTAINCIDILSEPFHLSLLRCIYTFKIQNLIKKFHIPLKNGCLLMGIPDPIGILEDREVYVTFEDTSTKAPLTGRILVYKNPCLHPGDLLTPTAVDKIELHHLHNVIVFPSKGSTSLPACTGGGDLDGDEFGIIWDKDLIPPISAIFPSLNYDNVLNEYKEQLKSKEPERKNPIDTKIPLHMHDNIQTILAESYCKIISNDLLGIISHYHVAISDMKENGSRDELSIQLARLASLSVDSPKTGITPTIPDEAKVLIKEKGYPDFMEKTESTAYPSEKLLGELYQLAKSVCFETNEWQNILNYYNKQTFKQKIPHSIPLEIFQIPGHEGYMQDAKIRYFEYSNALQRIMLSFGIETEAEVILGLIIKCHPFLSADKNKVTSALITAMRYLTEEFREIFERNTPLDCYAKKAAAWYLTVYQQQQSEETTFLSFAWIMRKELCDLLAKQPNHTELDLHCSIGSTAREYIMQQSEFIHTNVNAKMCLLGKISSAINDFCIQQEKTINIPENGKVFNVEVFGSVSKFLCELESDLDISISLTNFGIDFIGKDNLAKMDIKKTRLHLLRLFVSPSLEEVALSKIEKFNLDFPIITLTMDSEMDTRSDISVDVSIESDGVLKSKYILQLYRTTGGIFFAFFWILIHWGRHIGILKCHTSPKSTGLILTAEFEALILYIYDEMLCKPETVTSDLECDNTILQSLTNLLMNAEIEKKLGLMLEEFFRRGYKITSESVNEIVYTWPIQGDPIHTISVTALNKISALLFQGWHCLAYTRNIFKLFERVQVQLTFAKRFTPFMSDRIRSSTRFYEKSWNTATGALIKIESSGRNLLLTAQGSASAIHKLATEISLMESNSALTRKYKSNSYHYILDGSTLIIMSEYSAKCRVKLSSFEQACCKQIHTNNHKSFLISAEQRVNPNWKSEGVNRIQTLLWNQLSRFPSNNKDLLKNLKFKSRFGFFYILDGPDSFQEVGDSLYLDEFEKCLVKGNRQIDSAEDKKELQTNSTISQQPSHDKSFNKIIKKTSKYNEKVLKSTTSAFCPGLPMTGTDEDIQLERTKSVYVKSLEECGFVRQVDICKSYTWRVEIQWQFSFDIRINLDDNLHVVSISERPLIWMLATIVGNRNVVDQSKTHDIRLRSESARPVQKDSDIYRLLLPDGLKSSLISINEGEIPTICERLKTKMKIIKHNQQVEYYKWKDVIAKISTGIEYCRDNFSLGRKFCELSLFHNEDEFRDAVKSENNSCRIKTVAANAVDISLRLSDAISKFI